MAAQTDIQALCQELSEVLPCALWLYRWPEECPEPTPLYANRAARELMATSGDDNCPPEAALPLLTAARTGAAPETHAFQWRPAGDGEGDWYRCTAFPLGGPTLGLSLENIGEQRRWEEQLRKSEERYARITEAVTDYIYTVRVTEGETLETIHRPGCEAVTGYTVEDFTANPMLWLEMVPEEDRDRVLAHSRAILHERSGAPCEHRIRRKDGSIRWVVNTPVLHTDDAGALIAYDGILRDITERKETEEALRESEARYRRLFEQSHDAICITDTTGRILDANRRSCALLGRGHDTLAGMQFQEFVVPAGVAPIEEQVRALAAGDTGEVATQLRHTDGSLIDVEVRAGLVDAERGVVQLIVRDITQQKLLEDKLRQLEKMQAIGQLAGGVAHDFNNRLVTIQGFAQLLYDDIDDEELRGYAERILRGAKRAGELTHQMLTFARKRERETVPVNLHSSINEVVLFLEHSLDKRIRVHQILRARPASTTGDPAQIQNVFLNLAINARDAMPEGGDLTFETANVTLDAAGCNALPFELKPGPYVSTTISDTGEGMDEATRQHIFEPFFTTKPSGHGTGMGLATVYGTIADHGGAITVESRPGAGTTFTVCLPAAAGEASLQPPAIALPSGRRAQVLFIDDEEDVRDFAAICLRRAGLDVELKPDGTSGVEAYRARARTCDLIVLDMMLPDLSGREAFAALRAIHPDAPILLATGHTLTEEVHDLLEAGALGCLTKPFEREELLREVCGVLQRLAGPGA